MPSTARLPLASAAVALAALAACGPRAATRPAPDSAFDPARLRAEVAWLADPARMGRGTGTPGGQAAAAWIADRLAEVGVRPAFDARYLQTFDAPGAVTANVVAALPGRDPAVARHCILVGAHYDHLGHGGASLSPELAGTVYPGANDNASGVAALLAIARAVAADGPARRTVVFAAFGAEELRLLGSAWLAGHPPPGCPTEAMQLMVNLDTVGRPRDGKVYVDGTATARGLRELVDGAEAGPPRLPLTLAIGAVQGGSDQASYLARGVPALFLFTGADLDYHRPSDTPEKLDYPGLASIARLAARIVRASADGPPLEPTQPAAPPPRAEQDRGGGAPGTGAYLGAIPDFAERKEPGVLLGGVRPGSPAERAGIAGGDVLLRVGDARLGSLRDLASALRAHRPGDEVEVEWEHGGQRRTGKVRLGERK